MVVAVNERDPVAVVLGVAPRGLVEDFADDRGSIVGDARGEPLALRLGPRLRLSALALVGGQDVGRAARDGRGIVDGADLRDPLAVALLALGQAGLELALHLRRLLLRRRAQRLGAHHHSLAVAGKNQRIDVLGCGRQPTLIEGFKVDRATPGEALQLALARSLAGGAADRLRRIAERPSL